MNAIEQQIHDVLTAALIEGRAHDIFLERQERVQTPDGGSYLGEKQTLPPQKMRIIESTSRSGEVSTSPDISEYNWDSYLLAERSQDMQVGDEFSLNDRRYRVVELAENREWRKLGRLERLGTTG